MQIKSIETEMDTPFANGSNKLLLMVVDGVLEIKVEGYATGGQIIKVRSLGIRASSENDWEAEKNPAGCLNALADSEANHVEGPDRVEGRDTNSFPDFWGRCLVWAEPFTIAHVVTDCLSNA